MGLGMIYTAMPVTNAVPAVVAAPPGIVTLADLPPVAGRFAVRLVRWSTAARQLHHDADGARTHVQGQHRAEVGDDRRLAGR